MPGETIALHPSAMSATTEPNESFPESAGPDAAASLPRTAGFEPLRPGAAVLTYSGYALANADAYGFPIAVPLPARPVRRRVPLVLLELVETVLMAMLIFFGVRSVIQNFKVEGQSMEPSLHSGQYLLVNKMAYLSLNFGAVTSPLSSRPLVMNPLGNPERGDVIVFQFPRDPKRDFIKRVVAVGGDTVEVRGGTVFVNGQPLREPYIVENPAYSREAQVVPPDNFFVLGDNRNNSSDSHVWGPVPRDMIIGKAWVSYWPMSEWGLAPNYTFAAS